LKIAHETKNCFMLKQHFHFMCDTQGTDCVAHNIIDIKQYDISFYGRFLK
jgi:hypothetical protein